MIVATIIAISITFVFSRKIVGRLSLVANRAKEIADGDLSMEPIEPSGKDEIAEVAINLNQMQESLKRIVSEANDSSQQVPNNYPQQHNKICQQLNRLHSLHKQMLIVRLHS